MKEYILNILIWLDVGINTLFLGGSPYETLSSRIGKRADKGEIWACVLCRFLDRLDTRHCIKTQTDDRSKTLPNWWKL